MCLRSRRGVAWVFWNGKIVLVGGTNGEGEEERNYWDVCVAVGGLYEMMEALFDLEGWRGIGGPVLAQTSTALYSTKAHTAQNVDYFYIVLLLQIYCFAASQS